MTKTRQTIMDIAMNLNRIGNWVADGFGVNQKKIAIFIENTDGYISTVGNFDNKFTNTWNDFMKIYPNMKNSPKDNAENLMTWGNILTHRSKLI
ncbi:MAG: hypothetical protein ACD_26C00034G0012 [uncultured bacterium]|nr:MAG: hypothetical protein ACD_26C00034G0012 [uncultured bacterium]